MSCEPAERRAVGKQHSKVIQAEGTTPGDRLNADYARAQPLAAGILDYNRLENR